MTPPHTGHGRWLFPTRLVFVRGSTDRPTHTNFCSRPLHWLPVDCRLRGRTARGMPSTAADEAADIYFAPHTYQGPSAGAGGTAIFLPPGAQQLQPLPPLPPYPNELSKPVIRSPRAANLTKRMQSRPSTARPASGASVNAARSLLSPRIITSARAGARKRPSTAREGQRDSASHVAYGADFANDLHAPRGRRPHSAAPGAAVPIVSNLTDFAAGPQPIPSPHPPAKVPSTGMVAQFLPQQRPTPMGAAAAATSTNDDATTTTAATTMGAASSRGPRALRRRRRRRRHPPDGPRARSRLLRRRRPRRRPRRRASRRSLRGAASRSSGRSRRRSSCSSSSPA